MTDPVMVIIVGIAVILAGAAVFAWLVRAFRTETGPERVVAVLLALLVVESTIYENPYEVPAGLLHPEVGALSFRWFDLLVPVALAAYLIAGRRVPRVLPGQVLLWCAFLLWLAACGVVGALEGNSLVLVTFHAKAIVYLGAFALVALVPPKRWVESPALRRVIVGAVAAAALLLTCAAARIVIDLDIPLVPLVGFGQIGSDAATIFVVLGTGLLCVGVCADRGRLRLFALAVPLLLTPTASGQRAAMLGMVVALLGLVALLPLSARHVRVRATEVVLAGLAVVALVAALMVVEAVLGDAPRVPLAYEVQQAFESRGKQLSGQDRINQWEQARTLIAERPWLGWGLGKEYYYYSPGFFMFMRSDIAHNINIDLLMRTGVVGLLLFLAALLASLRDALRAWLDEADAQVAALALAVLCSLTGLVVKGFFESLFEKYRLALVIGGLVGVSVSIATLRPARVRARANRPSARIARRGALAR